MINAVYKRTRILQFIKYFLVSAVLTNGAFLFQSLVILEKEFKEATRQVCW